MAEGMAPLKMGSNLPGTFKHLYGDSMEHLPFRKRGMLDSGTSSVDIDREVVTGDMVVQRLTEPIDRGAKACDRNTRDAASFISSS